MKKIVMGLVAVGFGAGMVLAPTVASAEVEYSGETVEIVWALSDSEWQLEPSDDPRGDGWRVGEAGFPQTLVTGEIPCWVTVQIDTYRVEDVAALTADGLLHYGEDWDVIQSWRFDQGEACVEEEPVIEEETPVVEEPVTVEEPVRGYAEPEYLARTGGELWLLGVAGSLIVMGIAFLIGRRVGRDR